MARVKIEDVLDHLDSDLTRALACAVNRVLPDAEFDPHQLYRVFVQEAYTACSTWEYVPDHYVEK